MSCSGWSVYLAEFCEDGAAGKATAVMYQTGVSWWCFCVISGVMMLFTAAESCKNAGARQQSNPRWTTLAVCNQSKYARAGTEVQQLERLPDMRKKYQYLNAFGCKSANYPLCFTRFSSRSTMLTDLESSLPTSSRLQLKRMLQYAAIYLGQNHVQ